MSLLGKLLSGLPSTASSSSASPSTTAGPPPPPEAYLEDQHTYSLLFPTLAALCHNDHIYDLASGNEASSALPTHVFDTNVDVDLEMRDLRILIMQEATATSGSAYLLYDSHASPCSMLAMDRTSLQANVSPCAADSRRSISSPRKGSVGHMTRPTFHPDGLMTGARPLGAFDRRTPHGKTPFETESQRSVREYREDIGMIANCIFGSSDVWAVKRTETKVHPLPAELRAVTSSSTTSWPDGSWGRASLRSSSKLSQSYTSDSVAPGRTVGGLPGVVTPRLDRKKVLITRMFPVALPVEDPPDDHTPVPHVTKDNVGYFPPTVDGHMADRKPAKPQQKRTPMFAVALMIHLPSGGRGPSAPVSRTSFRGASSYSEADSAPSSYSSAKRAGWSVLAGSDCLDPNAPDPEDHLELVTQHWDIIMRALSQLQSVVTDALLPLLRHADTASPDPRVEAYHNRSPSASLVLNGRRLDLDRPRKPHKLATKWIQVSPNCLYSIKKIQQEVDAARRRMIEGIRTTRVVTGQGRWAIWRDQARIVDEWSGGKERGFFFSNLLTGFLGNHTDWLPALGYSARTTRSPRKDAGKEDDITLPARTVVIANDKIMARRVIFLLAAFLPAGQPFMLRSGHHTRTRSFEPQSQSPPAGSVPILREEPLRRKMRLRPSMSRVQPPRLSLAVPPTARQSLSRRASDATSNKPAEWLAPEVDVGNVRNCVATIASAGPVTPKPQFFNHTVRGTGPLARPESRGSLATEDLLRSLKRAESSGQGSSASSTSHGPTSGWGSMISGLWTSRRRGSSATEVSPSSPVVLDSEDGRPANEGQDKLSEMVDEVLELRRATTHSFGAEAVKSDRAKEEVRQMAHAAARQAASNQAAPMSPIKASVNADGIVDIDVPLPDYLSMCETAASSPSSSSYWSTPGMGSALDALDCRYNLGRHEHVNVGGWLPHFHSDFALQAVPSQADLIADIKACMRQEAAATVKMDGPASLPQQWVDVTSTIIADTTNFTIKRITYQRLLHAEAGVVPLATPQALSPTKESSSCEDRFIEEAIISMDAILIEAVDRLLAHGSKPTSNSSSRNRSRDIPAPKGLKIVDNSEATARNAAKKTTTRERSNSDAYMKAHRGAVREVHRTECKKIVLGALDELVRSVRDELSLEEEENSPFLRRQKARRERANLLREGVRTWLTRAGSAEQLDAPR